MRYKSEDGFGAGETEGSVGIALGAVDGTAGSVGLGPAGTEAGGKAGMLLEGCPIGGVAGATTGAAGAGASTSVAAEGTRITLLLKFTRTFCPSVEMKRTRVPGFKVTRPN
jgi:hypothetical protein